MKQNFCRSIAAIASVLCSALPAFAIDNPDSPSIDKGQLEVEYTGTRTQDHDATKNNIQGNEFDVNYGITDYWQAQIGFDVDRGAGGPSVLDGIELQSQFQFTKPGAMWIDTGVIITYTPALHRDVADTFETKFLAQKDTGDFTNIANIGFTQGLGSANHGGPDVNVIWSSRYNLTDYFAPGIELQSDFGQTNEHPRFNDQQHYLGPGAYGKLGGDDLFDIDYQVAYLIGLTPASSASAVRLQIDYDRHF